MWTVTTDDVLTLRGGGGERFTQFLDDLIRSQAFVSGCDPSNIATNMRATIADGGVDTEVKKSFATDPDNWFAVPSCWQYKTSEYKRFTDKKLADELCKQYAGSLVKGGFGYRLCICDDMPPQTARDWEAVLDATAKQLVATAAKCHVLNASQIAAWASRYPALVLKYFRRISVVQHFLSWAQSARAFTRNYISVPDWQANFKRIVEHADFCTPVTDVILSISGDAGVGKTRLTLEALATVPGLEQLVVYAIDADAAIRLATVAVNDAMLFVVLVADECTLEAREKLRRIVSGHGGRIRVITIDNFSRQPTFGGAQPRISQMPAEIVEQVLAENYPNVPKDRQVRYAKLSRGFLRFATYLATNDSQIATFGTLDPAMQGVWDFIYYRMPEDDRRCLEALSLVVRLGATGDVAFELDQLCAVTGHNGQSFIATARRIKDATGFVAQAGRYLYVTPEIVAQAAFQSAWSWWGATDPHGFLKRFPTGLLGTFQDRVAKSAQPDVRAVVADFFSDWIADVVPRQLADEHITRQLVVLAETNPVATLPRLRRLVEDATPDELIDVRGDFQQRWGPRRQLVWLIERLAAFPEYYRDAETILFRLATAENEPGIGNNATQIWRQLQRIVLSGTATPFDERLAILEERFKSAVGGELNVLLGGLFESLESRGWRMGGPPVVAGRITPDEWQPKSRREWVDCVQSVVALMGRLADGISSIRDDVMNVAIDRLYAILEVGLLEDARSLLKKEGLSPALLPKGFEAIDNFCLSHRNESHDDYVQRVRDWRASLLPSDLHGRIVAAIGIDPWHHRDAGDQQRWSSQVDSLASELAQDEASLVAELPWLSSPEAQSAHRVGFALAQIDTRAKHLNLILSAAARTRTTGLARGYVAGLLALPSAETDALNAALDQLEVVEPLTAFDISLVGEEETRSALRAIRLIRGQLIPPGAARGLLSGGFWQRIAPETFVELIQVLLVNTKNGDDNAGDTAITLVGYRTHDALNGQATSILEGEANRDVVWTLLDQTVDNVSRVSHWWFETLRAMVDVDLDRALQLGARALVSENFAFREDAQKFLVRLAGTFPRGVMKAIGGIMNDENRGWHFQADNYDDLIASIPVHIVREWLDEVGVVGARRIARHVPAPMLDENGLPEVPALTTYLLTAFEDDDRTFHEFAAGTANHGVMWGDIAEKYEEMARLADAFRNHPLRRIREWAEAESSVARKEAAFWRQEDEEDEIR